MVTELGYKAQYAYPKELIIGPALCSATTRRRVVEGLEVYGVPVRVVEHVGAVFDFH